MTKKHDIPDSDKNDSPAEEHENGTQESKRGSGFIWLLVAVGAIGGGFWAVDQGYVDRLLSTRQEEPTLTRPKEPQPAVIAPAREKAAAAPHKDISALLAKQKASEREQAKLRRDIAHMESTISQLNESIKILSQTIDEMKKSPTTIAVTTASQPDDEDARRLREQVAALTERLDRLQQDYTHRDDYHAAQLKLVQLADAIGDRAMAGEPFAQEMPDLHMMATRLRLDTHAVNTLQAHAQEGVMPLSALTRLFSETAQSALPYSLKGAGEPSLADNLRSNLAHVISIRKIEVQADDNSDEAHIARAEAELRAGNVEMALTHLEQLSEQPRSLFYEWQGQAQDYLDVHHAVARLKNIAMQQSGAE